MPSQPDPWLTRAPCDVTGTRGSAGFKKWSPPAELEQTAKRAQPHNLAEANAKRSLKTRTVLSEFRDSREAKCA